MATFKSYERRAQRNESNTIGILMSILWAQLYRFWRGSPWRVDYNFIFSIFTAALM